MSSLEKYGVGQYCIVRTYSAGVFAGELDSLDSMPGGMLGVVKNARRIWHWSGAATLSQLSVDGVRYPDKCKFPGEVPEVILTEVVEILPCSSKARESIEGVPVWAS